LKAHAVLKLMRKVHLYLGVFTTPALLFFAFTGAMQTFNLHEARRGSDYKPPQWIATLAQLHKKQTTEARKAPSQPVGGQASQRDIGKPAGLHGEGRSAGEMRPAEAGGPGSISVPRKSHLPMKIFFSLVSVSLALSVLTGAYLSYKYDRGWWLLTGMLAAGVVVPLCLLPF
jgi:hypothetical protein